MSSAWSYGWIVGRSTWRPGSGARWSFAPSRRRTPRSAISSTRTFASSSWAPTRRSWSTDVATYAGVELAEALPDDASGWLVTADEAPVLGGQAPSRAADHPRRADGPRPRARPATVGPRGPEPRRCRPHHPRGGRDAGSAEPAMPESAMPVLRCPSAAERWRFRTRPRTETRTAWQYHRGTMQPGREPVTRRLAAGLGSALASVTYVPSHAIRRTPLRERDRGLAARRLEALQALATELAGALTTAQITDLLMSRGIAALRADGAAVFLIDPGESALRAIGSRGHSENRVQAMARLPLDLPLPATDVARTGEPVFIEDPARLRQPLRRRRSERWASRRCTRAVAAVPLEANGHRFGVLALQLEPPPPDRAGPPGVHRARSPGSAPARWSAAGCSTPSGPRCTAPRTPSGDSTCCPRRRGSSGCRSTTRRSSAASPGIALPLLGDVCIVDVLAGRRRAPARRAPWTRRWATRRR